MPDEIGCVITVADKEDEATIATDTNSAAAATTTTSTNTTTAAHTTAATTDTTNDGTNDIDDTASNASSNSDSRVTCVVGRIICAWMDGMAFDFFYTTTDLTEGEEVVRAYEPPTDFPIV